MMRLGKRKSSSFVLCAHQGPNRLLILRNSLAQAEINLALAVLYRPGGPQFELFETDESDIIHVHDFMIPLPKLGSKGVRILVR